MFFLGLTSTTATPQQILTDVIGLLTGSITATTGLSASWVQSSSYMFNTTAAGWTLYDTAAGTTTNSFTPVVIRSAWSDSASNYKNLRFNIGSAGWATMNGYHTWDSGTHTGTLPHVSSPATTSSWQNFQLLANTYIMVSASSNYILINAFSNNQFGQGYIVGAFEFTRDDPWNTVANGYPSWFTVGDSSSGYTSTLSNIGISQAYNMSTAANVNQVLGTTNYIGIAPGMVCIDLNSSQNYGGFSSSNFLNNSYANTVGADLNKNAVSYMQPFGLRSTAASGIMLGGMTSATQSSVYLFKNIWNAGDEVVINGSTYFLIKAGTYATLLVKEI